MSDDLVKELRAGPYRLASETNVQAATRRMNTERRAADEIERLEAENARLREAPEPLGLAALDVLAERRRQIESERWSPQHDDEHSCGELADAAACYAAPAPHGLRVTAQDDPPKIWPWQRSWWKPKDRRSNLVRAGALILAEIERLDRARAALEDKR